MSEHRGNHLIEIGDPTDDSIQAPLAGPHVVIEYRDRGLPWMLVLPLLVTAAAVAIIGFKAFDPRPHSAKEEPKYLVAEVDRPPLRIIPDAVPRDPTGMPLPPPSPVALPPEALPAPVETSPPIPVPEVTSPPSPFLPEDAGPETTPQREVPAPVPPPEALPRASEFGFNLQALEKAEVRPDAVRPAANPPPVAQAPPEAEQPRTVDPNDLPRDPRQAERDRGQRFLAALKQRDEERARFHAELRAITRRFGVKAGPQIDALCTRYGTEPDAVVKAHSSRMLNVSAAGVRQSVRINLLRQYGWPEAGILVLDLAESRLQWEHGTTRTLPGSRDRNDALCWAATVLLSCPPTPTPKTAPARAAAPSPAATGRR